MRPSISSTPISLRKSFWTSVSTPSASTFRPSGRAIATMALTRARPSGASGSRATRLRSTRTASGITRGRSARLEAPVPKRSSARLTPTRRRAPKASKILGDPAASADSATCSCSRRGGRPLRWMSSPTRMSRPGCSSCRGDTLIDRRSCSRPRSRHRCSWVTAVCSAHSPMGWIRPVSSASGMKRSGDNRPSCGWFQRSKAPMPAMRPVASSIWGW